MKILDIRLWIGIILSLLILSSCVEIKDLDGILGSYPQQRIGTDEVSSPTQDYYRTSQTIHHGDEKRVALVIGNGAYRYGNGLDNPPHDAEGIKTALLRLGFMVIHEENLDRNRMEQALQEFTQQLQGASLGLFFYAGHGAQYQGKNFLVSVNANLDSRGKTLSDELVALDVVLGKMELSGVPTKIIILDACRDNPFAGRGLAEMKPRASYSGGTFIAYSTRPGSVAEDGDGYNSPYTESLLQFIDEPNQPVEIFFRNVRTAVKQKTGGRQIPWDESSLEGGDLCLAGCFSSEAGTNDYCTTKVGNGLYQGQCQKGLPHGQGVMKYSSGEYYQGNFQNGLRNGQGIQYLTDGTEMSGQFCNGRICN